MKPKMPPGGTTNGRVEYAATPVNTHEVKPSVAHNAGAAVLHATNAVTESASAKRRKRRKRAAEAAQAAEPAIQPATQLQNPPQTPKTQSSDDTVLHLR
jgi:hypothetical protein